MIKRGYLLLELLVALLVMAISSLMGAFLQASISCWHKEARQYIHATNLAQTILWQIQSGKKYTNTDKEFAVTIEKNKPDQLIPIAFCTVSVSFTTPRGQKKEIAIEGALYEKK